MRSFPARVDAYTPNAAWTPDVRSRWRYLMDLLGQERAAMVHMALGATLWYAAAAMTPELVGRIVDAIRSGDVGSLGWTPALLVLATLAFVAAGMYISVSDTRLMCAVRTRHALVIAHKVSQLGPDLPKVATTGEVVSLAESDASHIMRMANRLARLVGAVVALAVILTLMFSIDVQLALVVLIATPLIIVGAVPLLKPVEKMAGIERERASTLTTTATDIVAGLRILRGIGGERAFADTYRRRSVAARQAAVRTSWLQQLPSSWWTLGNGALIVLLAWIGGTKLVNGQLTAGELVAFFGFATALQFSLGTFWDLIGTVVPAWVALGKSVDFLRHEPAADERADAELPDVGVVRDDVTGIAVEVGVTVLVSATPDVAADLADTLGGLGDRRRVNVGGVSLASVPTAAIRRRILVSHAGAEILSGTLQEALDPHGTATRERAEAALRAACADDVFELMPHGWASTIDERGRGLSGGQRQRLVLARALLADADVFILVEPTSAVDAHTEARIAQRVRDYRAGRPTLVVSSSPLWTHAADAVAFHTGGDTWRCATHDDLSADPAYRRVVLRTQEDDDV